MSEQVSEFMHFYQGDGETVDVRGKVHYPQYLTVSIDRRMAFDIIESLARQLGDSNRNEMQFNLYGKLDKEDETQ